MPDYLYTQDNGGVLYIVEPVQSNFILETEHQRLISLGVQGPQGIQGPVGPVGPPNTTPVSTVANNGLFIAADGGLYVAPPAWGSTSW